MSYRSLRSFLERLERAGELVRVADPVDPVLEMAALADRAAKQEGPALLFENPRTSAAGDKPPPYGSGNPRTSAAGDKPPPYGSGNPRTSAAGDEPPPYGSGNPRTSAAGDKPPPYGSGNPRTSAAGDGHPTHGIPAHRRDAVIMPVAMNLFGTRRRAAWALSCEDLETPANELRALLHMAPPVSFWDKLMMLPKLGKLAAYMPKHVGDGPVREIVETEPDLRSLPVLTTWPHDGGPFITLPQVVTRDPETGLRNVGMYRLQVLGPRHLAMHWQLHKTATAHFRAYRKRGERMPVAIALGGDPALTYCASAPLPPGIDEYLFAGFLRKEGVPLVKCVTNDLEVPAEADLVIEGFVDPAAPLVREGPFGDHTGYYSLADDYPALEVTCLTRRRDAVYPATVVGPPPMEDLWLGKATERLFLPLLQTVFPEVVDMSFPAEGVFHNLCFVAMRKEFPGHAKKLMHGMWGSGQMANTKTLVVFDDDVDVHDHSQCTWRAFANVDARRDLVVLEGPVDVLDHAAPTFALGAKLGVDATRKWAEEGGREWPEPCVHPPELLTRMDALYERIVPAAPPLRRPNIAPPPAASWSPRKGAA